MLNGRLDDYAKDPSEFRIQKTYAWFYSAISMRTMFADDTCTHRPFRSYFPSQWQSTHGDVAQAHDDGKKGIEIPEFFATEKRERMAVRSVRLGKTFTY